MLQETANLPAMNPDDEGIPYVDHNNGRRCVNLQRFRNQLLLQPRSIQALLCILFSLLMITILGIGYRINTVTVTGLTVSQTAADTAYAYAYNIKPILLFIHLHKAGGARIVQSIIESNKYTLHEPNANGNPQQDIDNKKWDIYFGTFDKLELNQFVKQLNDKKVTFIAMESHFFASDNFEMMRKLNEFDTFTMIRDPFTRIISNYFFDINAGFVDESELNKFETLDEKLKWFCQNTNSVFNHNNYYVRFFNGIQDQNAAITEQHLENAKNVISKFDAIGILEFEQTWNSIENRYGITLKDVEKINANNNKHENPTNKFGEWFKKENKLDFQLYDYAVHISQLQIAN